MFNEKTEVPPIAEIARGEVVGEFAFDEQGQRKPLIYPGDKTLRQATVRVAPAAIPPRSTSVLD